MLILNRGSGSETPTEMFVQFSTITLLYITAIGIVVNAKQQIKAESGAKVNSVQEACAECFAVHILKSEILQTTWKNETKNIKMLWFIDEQDRRYFDPKARNG